MKTKVIGAILIFFINTITAQVNFFGLTSNGGPTGNNGLNAANGGIIKTDGVGNWLATYNVFSIDFEGSNPENTMLCEATNNKLYGVTRIGGTPNDGVLFEYDPATNSYAKKIEFISASRGNTPTGNLILASSGKLYGMTGYGGGSGSAGVLYEYDPLTNIFVKKLSFNVASKGSFPMGSLVQAASGKMYGLTSLGGASSKGVLFEYDATTNTYTKRIDFSGTLNGSEPQGSLIQATNGKLYGMTQKGGANNLGVLFEYDTITNTLTKKLDFDGANKGSSPTGSLFEASNGKLYGMTNFGGANGQGAFFEYDPATNLYTKILDFSIANGAYPQGDIMQAANGNLYGMTTEGGTNNKGILFEYNITTGSYVKKLDFTVDGGNTPTGALMQTASGILYGTTKMGGHRDAGVLFEYNPTTNVDTKKFDFQAVYKGRYPVGSLMKASNGKLYGTTKYGGTFNNGVIFEFDPVTNVYVKKIDFNNVGNGKWPMGNLIEASNGKFYGMTSAGGLSNLGVLFEYDPVSNTIVNRLDMNFTTGCEPYGSLLQASNGKLYGLTSTGGVNNFGVVFEYDPATAIYTKKIDFNAVNGGYAAGSLIQASNGKLYGMTSAGGNCGNGNLFEYDYMTNTLTSKFDFCNINGGGPYGSLVQSTTGKLYGITSYGGVNNDGVLFEYDIVSNTYTKKKDFDNLTGRNAHGSLLQASTGKLYGMTNEGFSGGVGVLFEYDHLSNTFTNKYNLNSLAANPFGDLIEACVTPAPSGITSQTFCAGATVANLTATGSSIAWYNSAAGTTPLNPTDVLTNGAHYYASQTNGCESAGRLDVVVLLNPVPALTVTTSDTILCSGQTATLSVSGASGYSWSTGASTSSISVTPAVTTTYTVTGTASGCSGTATITQNVSICTGIETMPDDAEALMYPNPTSDVLTIYVPSLKGNTEVRMFNPLGELVLNESITAQNSSFSIRYLPGGIYFVNVYQDDHIIKREKIVLNK